MADSDNSTASGLSGLMQLADPQLLMSIGAGLMSGARYGSNAGEGLMQGLQMYQGMKQAGLQRQLTQQQIQQGNIANQRQQMMLGAAQQAMSGASPQPVPGQPPTMPPQGAPPPQSFLPGISQMSPSGGAPAMTPGAAPTGGGGLAPPTMDQIYGTTYPGGTSPNFTRAMSMFSQDPAAALGKAREDQIKLAQQYYAPQLAKWDSIIKSPQPSKAVQGAPELMNAWPQLAQTLGMDPVKDFNDNNVKLALTHLRNQFSSSLSEGTEAPPEMYQTTQGPLGSVLQTELGSGKMNEVVKPQPLSDVLVNGQPTKMRASAAEGQQPFNQITYGTVGLQDPKVAGLDAALTTANVNIPGGRNGSQYVARLQNLISANPGMAPQDIANQVRTGQLDFAGAKRSASQLAATYAATDVASRQIEKNFDSLAPYVQKYGVPVVNDWINGLQRNLTPGGNKDATAAQGYLLAIAGEYAKIRGGGTGAAAPAEGEQKEALKYMNSILTQGGFDGARQALTTEATNKRASYQEGLRNATAPGASVGQVGGAPVKLNPGQSHTVGGFTVTRVN